ncbi:DUF222 domain-containing protein, partial [Rugosimonospora africana]|uniref:DUF222 domain-containing protein n=1 Tax=Rugosimonospora africana TaxID=556532 RepID=UPI001942C854
AQHQADGEKFLIEQCAQLGPKELGWLAERLLDQIAPEVAEQRAAEQLARSEERAYADRRFNLTDLHGDARVRVSGWLDRESAAVVRAAIDPLWAPRPNPDGCDPRSPDPRTPGQRRADALVDVCRLALACRDLPDNGGDRPQVVVTVDIDDLREQTGAATLDDGTVFSPAAARRLACDAGIIPAVLGGTGQVLDVGR